MTRRRGRGARLEMTPLMDVMLLILVFFIYCIFGMTVRKGVKVDLPGARGADERGERIEITIKADDTMQFNGVDMPREAIVGRARALAKAGAEVPIVISGDRKSSLGAGIGLLGELREAGVDKVGFLVSGKSE